MFQKFHLFGPSATEERQGLGKSLRWGLHTAPVPNLALSTMKKTKRCETMALTSRSWWSGEKGRRFPKPPWHRSTGGQRQKRLPRLSEFWPLGTPHRHPLTSPYSLIRSKPIVCWLDSTLLSPTPIHPSPTPQRKSSFYNLPQFEI